MKLRPRILVLPIIAILCLNTPSPVQAGEEKPASMEAILEELSALRNMVEAQQRQIEELRAALQPTPVALPLVQQKETPPSADELTKKVETLSTNLGGFKFSGD